MRSHPARPLILALFSAVLLAGLHTVLVWGYTTIWWGDYGVLLHMIERTANGQIPFLDFFYQHPPLTLWILGAWGAIADTNLASVWSATSAVFLAIAILYVLYARRVIADEQWLIPVTGVGLILAVAFAHVGSAPLPLGMYSGAQPIGFLFLLAALIVTLGAQGEGWTRLRALGVGVLTGLCILAKQDFWLPALVVLTGSVILADARRRLRILVWSGPTFLTVVGVGVTVIGVTAGWEALPGIATGFGLVGEGGFNRLLPSWRRLTVEALVLSVVAALVALAVRISGSRNDRVLIAALSCCIALTAIYVFAGLEVGERLRSSGLPYWATNLEWGLMYHVREGSGLLRPLFGHLKADLLRHLFPVLLPLSVMGMHLARWDQLDRSGPRSLLTLVVAVAIAARVRRGFEYTEWFHFLLEVPAYVLAVRVHVEERTRRAMVVLLCAGFLVGGWAYYKLGVGPLTESGTAQKVETRRGTVRWSSAAARDFRKIRQLLEQHDPAHRRPVYTFGHNGAINYFTDRPAAGTSTVHPVFNIRPPEAEFRAIASHDPPPLLIYHRAYERAEAPQSGIDLAAWLRPVGPNEFIQNGKPAFDQLREKCRLVGRVPEEAENPFFWVYDC